MGNPTFRSFYDVVRELEDVYDHKELWLYSGLPVTTPDEVINDKHNWKSPKILKRDGKMVAERISSSGSWQLVGDYKNIQSQPSATPWQSCLIDHFFMGHYILVE
ncbi:hypothetical protein ACTSFU_005408 [Klebsiella michiganensis]